MVSLKFCGVMLVFNLVPFPFPFPFLPKGRAPPATSLTHSRYEHRGLLPSHSHGALFCADSVAVLCGSVLPLAADVSLHVGSGVTLDLPVFLSNTCACSYLVSGPKSELKLGQEVVVGLASAVALGWGTLFFALWTGLYV